MQRFEQIYAEHADAISAYVRRRAPEDVVDDVVSDVFLVCWRRLDDVPEKALPWLYAVARKTLANERRRRGRTAPRPGRRRVRARAGRRLRHSPRAFAELSDTDREVLAARRVGGAVAPRRRPGARLLGGRVPRALPPREVAARVAARGRCVLSTRTERSDEMRNDVIARLAAANPVPAAACRCAQPVRVARGSPSRWPSPPRSRCPRSPSRAGSPTCSASRTRARPCRSSSVLPGETKLDQALQDMQVGSTMQSLGTLNGVAFYAARNAAGNFCLAIDHVDQTYYKGVFCDLNADNFPSADVKAVTFPRTLRGRRGRRRREGRVRRRERQRARLDAGRRQPVRVGRHAAGRVRLRISRRSTHRGTSCRSGRCRASAQPAALEVRAEEVLGAGGRHRGGGTDLQREGGRRDDLREAVDLARPGAAQQLEPLAARVGRLVPPPTVPTSRPGKRIDACRPPSTRRPVPCAIELVPTMPRSWPVAAKTAAIADAGVNATDCMPDATAPCVPAHESASRSAAVVRSTRRDRLVGERHLRDHRLAVAGLEELERRLLVAAHVRLEHRALDRHRRVRQHVRHVQRVGVAGHHVRPDRVAGRPAPEHVAHRPDDVRLHLAQHGVARELRQVGSSAATRASRRRARRSSARASARRPRPCRRSTTRA